MFRRTVRMLKREVSTNEKGKYPQHEETYLKTVWWFLFIPIFIRYELVRG